MLYIKENSDGSETTLSVPFFGAVCGHGYHRVEMESKDFEDIAKAPAHRVKAALINTHSVRRFYVAPEVYSEEEESRLSDLNDDKTFEYAGRLYTPCDWGGHYRQTWPRTAS